MNPFGVLPMWGGLAAIVKGGWQMWEGDGSVSWTKTEAKVRDTQVVMHQGGRNEAYFEAVVEYEYEVGNEVYISTRWSYGDENEFNDELEAQNYLTGYTQGMSVDAFYDPRQPARSVLVRGKGNSGMVAAVIGAVIFLFGLYNTLT